MELLSTIFYFIIAIFILVTAHEFGHFITARMFGMRVDWFLQLWPSTRTANALWAARHATRQLLTRKILFFQ